RSRPASSSPARERSFRSPTRSSRSGTRARHWPAWSGASTSGRSCSSPSERHEAPPMRRLGVDVGGTFTDLIYVDDEAGKILVHKTATTPDDPSQGTVEGIRELTREAGVSASALDQVFHG